MHVYVCQAVDSRDSMAMALYSQCFTWIIRKLNNRINGSEDFRSIGILDIFGFENFEVKVMLTSFRQVLTHFSLLMLFHSFFYFHSPSQVNRFEQFNINYANEKLQEYFNKHIFSLEQLEYNK